MHRTSLGFVFGTGQGIVNAFLVFCLGFFYKKFAFGLRFGLGLKPIV